MQYRREIDGLRAVAVVPVILFHAGVAGLSGGFVGVDVFFVISGYLITTIILTEQANGDFTLAGFYERRARRILPALYVVLFTCLPAAWAWMPPDAFASFSRSVAATVLFVSNVHFWETISYFGPNTDLQPLLHTWSLAVEEQFYLVFPLLMLLIGPRRRRLAALILVTMAAASLLLSEWGWRNEPQANFYFTFSRFWELLAGALCALALFERAPFRHDIAAITGLGLIAVSIVWFDKTTPFPSVYALFPVIGTCLIILFAGSGTLVARLLSGKYFVGIGLISFSAYLWHQPLFAFARSLFTPNLLVMLVLSTATLGLAYLSWRFVEQPFRRREFGLLPKRASVFAASGIGLVLLLAFGIYGEKSDGAPYRTAPNGFTFAELALDPQLSPNYGLGQACTGGLTTTISAVECRTTPDPTVLLWGDSYAMHLAPALQSSAHASATGFQQITKSQCWPILNLAWPDQTMAEAAACIDFNDAVLNWLSRQPAISTVILSSPFNTPDLVRNRDGQAIDNTDDGHSYDQIVATVQAIRAMGKQVVIIAPPPTTGADLGACLVTASLWGKNLARCDFPTSDFARPLLRTYKLLARVAETIPVIFLHNLMCKNGTCATSDNIVFLYRDEGHLSVAGSAALGKRHDLLGLALSQAAK